MKPTKLENKIKDKILSILLIATTCIGFYFLFGTMYILGG